MDPTDVVRRKLMLGLKGLSGTQMLQGVNTTVKLRLLFISFYLEFSFYRVQSLNLKRKRNKTK